MLHVVPPSNRIKRHPYGPPPPPLRPVYPPGPVYRPYPPPYAPPPPVYRPVALTTKDDIVIKEAKVVVDVDSLAADKPKDEEKEEIEVVANTDNASSAKAKILPVNVNVTANAGVKLMVEALNNLLRKGLLPGGVLGGAPVSPAPLPAPALLPPAGLPAAGLPPAETVKVDVDVDVDLNEGTATETHRVHRLLPGYKATESDISPEEMKKLENKLEKLIREIKSGKSHDGPIDELLGLPPAAVEAVLKKLLPGLDKK